MIFIVKIGICFLDTPPLMHSRRDSGIEADTGREWASDGESRTVDTRNGSPKRVQRVISADSAFGDEMEVAE